MLRRSTKIQLLIFVAITLVGIAYVGANYVGLTPSWFGPKGCTVKAQFTNSGGIFSDAEVTYRGVTVGKVGSLHLIKHGVSADLHITNCSGSKIPADTTAAVADRSVIGEQYVNLVPANDKGPYLKSGDVIPMSKTSIPIAPQQLLSNLDDFVNSVDTTKLRDLVSELGKAFDNEGPALGSLLDSTNSLLTAAEQNLPQTIQLIEDASTVLDTQIQEQQPLQDFTHSLDLLSAQLKKSDPDIRHLLDAGPSDLNVVRNFVKDNRTDLGAVLANLGTLGQIVTRHLGGVEEILELYPALAAGGQTTVRSDGVAALGLVLNVNNPPDCGDPGKGREGYQGTPVRSPADTSPQAPNVAAHCTAPESSGVNVRGSANVPGGDPISASGGNVAYPRATTKNTETTGAAGSTGSTVNVNTTAERGGVLGGASWLAILSGDLK